MEEKQLRVQTVRDITHKLSQEIGKLPYKYLKYILISVGTNDLDEKDHQQVIGELELLVADIRTKYPGIQFIINEVLPRSDHRNSEVSNYGQYQESN